jgi:hypothetical protein
MAIRGVAMTLMLVAVAGCNSISSSMLNRLETDDFVGNSNGEPKKHCQTRPYKGVPITLRVPTHVDVAVQEKVRFSFSDGELCAIRTPKRHLSVDTELIYTDKVFTVDVKRPAAGTADYTLEFGGQTASLDNRQYFKELKSKIVDETIEDVTGAIDTVFSAVPASKSGDDNGETLTQRDDVKFFDQTRTVAWKRFDVDAADFEMQVAAFVQQHLNGCHSCAGYHASNPVEHAQETAPEVSQPAVVAPEVSAAAPAETITGFSDLIRPQP